MSREMQRGSPAMLSPWRVLNGATPFFVMSGDQSWGQRKPKTKQLPPTDLFSYPATPTLEGPWRGNTSRNDQNWMKWSLLLLACQGVFPLPATLFMGFDAGSAVLEPSPQSRMICLAKWVANKKPNQPYPVSLDAMHEVWQIHPKKTSMQLLMACDGLCTYCMFKYLKYTHAPVDNEGDTSNKSAFQFPSIIRSCVEFASDIWWFWRKTPTVNRKIFCTAWFSSHVW